MSDKSTSAKQNSQAEELRRHAERAPQGLIVEFIDFLVHNKKWWLIPIVVVLLLLGLLVLLSGTGAAPFIYTLF